MAAIIADHYREEYAALAADPIVIDMAAGLADVQTSDIAHPNGSPRFEFMLAANDEYRSRGGTISRSIGGVATALLGLRNV